MEALIREYSIGLFGASNAAHLFSILALNTHCTSTAIKSNAVVLVTKFIGKITARFSGKTSCHILLTCASIFREKVLEGWHSLHFGRIFFNALTIFIGTLVSINLDGNGKYLVFIWLAPYFTHNKDLKKYKGI